MTDELRIGFQELLRKAQVEGDANYLKEGVRALSQAIMAMEVEDHIGAARHERGPGCTGQRNGYRQGLWDTRVGAVELNVPRVRASSYFPLPLEPRSRRAERALSAVVLQEACVHGVSTHKVDELLKAWEQRRGPGAKSEAGSERASIGASLPQMPAPSCASSIRPSTLDRGLGHSDIRMTLAIYTHATDGM